MKINDTIKLIVSIAVCESAGIIGSIFTIPSIPSWYATLVKPALNPPAWIFAPVWTTLFALMGVAVFLVWKEKEIASSPAAPRKKNKIALSIFVGQLVLNILWSIIFFGLHNPGLAFVNIIVLWFAIVGTIIVFYKISKLAAYLFIPYILWVSFAMYLNYAIWMLN